MANASSTSHLLSSDHKGQPLPPTSYGARATYLSEPQLVSAECRRCSRIYHRLFYFSIVTILVFLVFNHLPHPISHLGSWPLGHDSSRESMDLEIIGMPTLDRGDPDTEWDCVSGDGWDFSSPGRSRHRERHWVTTSFEIPANAEQLTFFARGAYSFGNVSFVYAESAGDQIKVDVEAGYYNRHALDRASACRFKSEHHGQGVAILTPRHSRHHDHRELVMFYVTIRIPSQATGTQRHIPWLNSYFPLFSQTMDNLTDVVDFGKLSLRSTNQPIAIEDLIVRSAICQTTNAQVRGSVTTYADLKMLTTNAKITSNIIAYGSEEGTTLLFHTTNSHLTSNMSLLSSTTSNKPAAFNITAGTTNAPLDVSHLESPLNSVVNAKYATTNSLASVRLDAAYEGSFTATTTHFTPSIHPIQGAKDPAGRNRERKIHTDFVVRGYTSGTVGWEPLEHERSQPGSIFVASTNSPVYLTM